MTVTPYIGMKLWQFDPSIREYERNPNTGRAIGGPIWRKKWVPVVIHGETSRSWLVGREGFVNAPHLWDKVPKKIFPGNLVTSEEEIDKLEFVQARHNLAQRINDCRDYDALKAIEQILDEAKTQPKCDYSGY